MSDPVILADGHTYERQAIEVGPPQSQIPVQLLRALCKTNCAPLLLCCSRSRSLSLAGMAGNGSADKPQDE